MHSLKCAYFVAGTDTEIGKTMFASSLLYALTQIGVRTAGMKPVAAGAELRQGIWHNDDADALAAQASVTLPSALTTPYLLREPTAPHIAARSEGLTIDLPHILDCYKQIAKLADAVVVEGVGGFRVPLNQTFDSADLTQKLGLPVILVVGIRLGCINHALLTADAIASRGMHLAGWVANIVDDELLNRNATIEALASRIAAPLLGEVPRLGAKVRAGRELAQTAASYLSFSSLADWPHEMDLRSNPSARVSLRTKKVDTPTSVSARMI